MNLALVLGGGAARGAFHLGILAYLEDKGIEINAYSGSSIGAIISCSHASGIESRKMLEIFKSDEVKNEVSTTFLRNGDFIFPNLMPLNPKNGIINYRYKTRS